MNNLCTAGELIWATTNNAHSCRRNNNGIFIINYMIRCSECSKQRTHTKTQNTHIGALCGTTKSGEWLASMHSLHACFNNRRVRGVDSFLLFRLLSPAFVVVLWRVPHMRRLIKCLMNVRRRRLGGRRSWKIKNKNHVDINSNKCTDALQTAFRMQNKSDTH